MAYGDYNPQSIDANFARLFERLDAQDVASETHRRDLAAKFTSFHIDQRTQDERIGVLEQSRWKQRGFVAAIAFLVPLAWQRLTGSPHPKQ